MLGDDLNLLTPKDVWRFFSEICQIPRPSKHEEAIIAYLESFAKHRSLDYLIDKAGNIIIYKEATQGYENKSVIVLQSHVDMVCEKNADTTHDFFSEPIKIYVEDAWIKARGTTLGADNGIGVAMQLALLDAKDIQHAALECIFTVDEETGLTGASLLDTSVIKGRTMINLDSEDEGIIFIGCAGGIETIGYCTPEYSIIPDNCAAFLVTVSGLQGGHSGDDINKGRSNAIKIITRLLYSFQKLDSFYMFDISGGNLHNAIPREAKASFVIEKSRIAEFLKESKNLIGHILDENKDNEPNLQIKIKETQLPEKVYTKDFSNRLICTLYALPHGVVAMSNIIPGLVETSTNLAVVRHSADGRIEIGTSQRSAMRTAKNDTSQQVASVFILGGMVYSHTMGYPGWTPNKNSRILKHAEVVYQNVFGKEPIITAIHAGLECALFVDKFPGLDVISVGPTIKGAHSPDERLDIESVEKFWKYLIEILEKW